MIEKAKQEERFIHFDSCVADLNTAWNLLNLIKTNKNNPFVGALFKLALIEYSKPYLVSQGNVLGRHRLDDTFIPENHKELHFRILAARNKILAHSDLRVRDATLNVVSIDGYNSALIAQNVITGVEELGNTDTIIELIEKSLDLMYKELDCLEAGLFLTPTD